MNKTLKITNGIESFDIECTNKIHTRVSEECLLQMTYKNKIIPEQVVLQVLLEELKIANKEEWSLCI
jgi:hypothetical protein